MSFAESITQELSCCYFKLSRKKLPASLASSPADTNG
jgi:hypothetical protein